MFYLNIVWPALYISQELGQFWLLLVMTILIETLTVKLLLALPWKKALTIASIGNLVSGLIGTFIMCFAMLFWHLTVDQWLSSSTFSPINWTVSYIFMCLGSVLIEILAIKLLFKIPLKKLFIPLLLGNVLTYVIIFLVSYY